MKKLCIHGLAPGVVAVMMSASGLAQPASFSPFTVTTPNDSGAGTLQSMQLPAGVLAPGSSYTTYKVTLDWDPDAFANATQWNAIWALTDSAPEPGTTFYADPGPALDADITLVPQFQPGSLSWVGALDPVILGSNDLYFNWLQVNAFTGTTWSDISITLDTQTLNTKTFSGDTTGSDTWTRFRDPREQAFDTPSNIQNIPYDSTPFFVDSDGIYEFTTMTDFGPGERWDGVIAIYADFFDPDDPDLNRLGTWAGTAPGTPSFGDRTLGFELEEGVQYFFLQTGRRSFDFGAYEGVVQGVGDVTFAIIPSPGALGLAALALAGFSRRRRCES
ncbi:MAG: hypothetical protein EA376_14385 [Phycisphaeraceae bacterium]|nr:MAG: hypothetical protein EA376_14385 [Phycisphaeraceae bacterium]